MAKGQKPPGGPYIRDGENVGPVSNLDKVRDEKGEVLWGSSIKNEQELSKRPKVDGKVEDRKKELSSEKSEGMNKSDEKSKDHDKVKEDRDKEEE